MDMFDTISNRLADANIRVVGGNSNCNGNSKSMPRSSSPRPTDIMSDDALKGLDTTLQRQFQNARDERTRNRIQNQIYSVQEEISKRQSAQDQKPVGVVSSKEQQKIKGIGINVGTGALIFGVLGFLIGATTTKPKLAIVWGIGGATLGGLGAFFMSQEDSGIKVMN